MRTLPLLLLLACAPKLPVGDIPIQLAQAPVQVIEQIDNTSANVYFEAIVGAGSAYDPVGQEGLANLVARSLVDAGSGERPSSAVRDALYPTGNQFSLVVDREWVSLRLRCHIDHQALCAQLFADALTAPRFDANDVLRLREDAEYGVGDGLLSNEEALGQEMLEAFVFEGHPYGHPVQGRGGVLPTLTADDAKRFHDTHYVRQATLVGVAGGVTEQTLADLRDRLVKLPTAMPVDINLQQPSAVSGRSMTLVATQTDVTGIHFAHPLAVDRAHEDWPALALAMTAMGAHRQSFGRLFRAIRNDRGLNYGDYSYIEPYVERGGSLPQQGVLRSQPYFYVWIRPTSLENGPFALRMAMAEVEGLVSNGLSPEEFEITREYLQGWTPLLAQDPGRRLSYALEAQAAGVPDLISDLPTALNALDVAAVNAAIKRHITPENLKIVVVTGDPEGFKKAILEESATPIVYRDVVPDEAQAQRDTEVASWPLLLEAADVWTTPAEGIFQ
ncbi:MAG: hypothetical protein GWP91_22815 [Rhodobacterales bacterium]|nr:hypothetical protein [Rhodobacterales bacterium]